MGKVRFVWRGATVAASLLDQIQDGMETESEEILDDLHSSIHVKSGEMRDKAYASVEIRGTKRALVAGSTAEHAAFEELSPNNHPQIRGVMDRHTPHITQRIAAARRAARA